MNESVPKRETVAKLPLENIRPAVQAQQSARILMLHTMPAFLPQCLCMCVCSVVSDSATPWTVTRQAPLPWDSPGKNTGVGCHPPPGDLPDPGIEPASLAPPAWAGGFFTTAPPGLCLSPTRASSGHLRLAVALG